MSAGGVVNGGKAKENRSAMDENEGLGDTKLAMMNGRQA